MVKKVFVLLACASSAIMLSSCSTTVADSKQPTNADSSQTIEATDTNATNTTETVDAPANGSSFVDGVLTTPEMKI